MKKFFSFITTLLLLQQLISAQETDSIKTILSEVVVTATKTETPYYAIGSSVTLITSDEISARHLQTVVDILRTIPGLSVIQQGGPGKLANVFMRGANTNHTLVIIDGVEMNDASSPNNAFDFSSLNTNDIDRIEIVRGPQSILYGSDAIAGVINIITKHGSDKPQYTFYGEGGSNNYYRGNISAAGNYSIFNYALSASRNRSDGVSASDFRNGNVEKDKYSNNFFSSRLELYLSKETRLDLIYKFTKAETGLDQGEKFGDDPNYIYNLEEQLFKGNLSLSLYNGKWQQQINASLVKRFGHSSDQVDLSRPVTSSDNYNKSQRIKFDWQNNFRFIDNNLITLGIETETEKAFTSYFSTSEWGTYESVFPEQSLRTNSIYLQDQISFANSFFTSAGLRFDENQKFGSVITFRITPAYFIRSTGTKLKMSYGTGFKAPSLFNLFDPSFGNPDLQPEKSLGWDAGLEQYLVDGRLSFGITYFNLILENMFGFDSNFKTVNISKASSSGLEITASVKSFENFSVDGNYTFTETKDEYELSPDYGKPLLRRPKHQASININYQINSAARFSLLIRYCGEREDKDFSLYPAQRVIVPDYTLVNFSTSYKLSNNIELNARIENLFDKQYEEVLYYGTLGRCFYIGAKLDL